MQICSQNTWITQGYISVKLHFWHPILKWINYSLIRILVAWPEGINSIWDIFPRRLVLLTNLYINLSIRWTSKYLDNFLWEWSSHLEEIYKKRSSEEFRKSYRKTPVLDTLFYLNCFIIPVNLVTYFFFKYFLDIVCPRLEILKKIFFLNILQFNIYSVGKSLFEINNKNPTLWVINTCSKKTISTLERCPWKSPSWYFLVRIQQ